jgi:hypothetical protein
MRTNAEAAACNVNVLFAGKARSNTPQGELAGSSERNSMYADRQYAVKRRLSARSTATYVGVRGAGDPVDRGRRNGEGMIEAVVAIANNVVDMQ